MLPRGGSDPDSSHTFPVFLSYQPRPCLHIGLTLFSLGGTSLADYKQVLGPYHQDYEVERLPGESDIQFYVEGLVFPDTDFSGLVSLSVSLVGTEVNTR